MTVFDVLNLIGGLVLFLYGMNVMGNALEKRAGGGLRSILSGMTSTTFVPNNSCTRGQVVTFLYRAMQEADR